MIKLAWILQRADRSRIETALEFYTKHYEYAFEDGVDCVAEWSKPFLLLRVIFALPEDPQALADLDVPLGNFGMWPLPSCTGSLNAVVMPIRWTAEGPELTALGGGYGGGRYPAEEEYAILVEHFPFRDLDALLQEWEEKLEKSRLQGDQKWRSETGRTPINSKGKRG